MKNEKEIRKLLGNDYHLSIEMKDGEIMQWVLFKNYKDSAVYFSEDNKAIMRSGINTEEELYEFAKKHHRLDFQKVNSKVRLVLLLGFLVLSLVNAIFVHNTTISTFILSCDLILIIWSVADFHCYNHNWKIDMLELEESFERRKKELLEKLKKAGEDKNEI